MLSGNVFIDGFPINSLKLKLQKVKIVKVFSLHLSRFPRVGRGSDSVGGISEGPLANALGLYKIASSSSPSTLSRDWGGGGGG